jgi:hypothetical protein
MGLPRDLFIRMIAKNLPSTVQQKVTWSIDAAHPNFNEVNQIDIMNDFNMLGSGGAGIS